MNSSLIISHFDSFEFLELLHSLQNEFNFIIYNKSQSLLKNLPLNRIEIKCENIGREGYTYINHIINNYDNLNDINVFIQDDFHNHLFNLDYFIDSYLNNKHKEFYQFPSASRSKEYPFTIKRTVVNGCIDFGRGNVDGIFKFSKELDIPLPEIYETEVCANFLISKNRIHRYSKEKYEQILDWLKKDIINEWTLEYSWKFLFM
jgi:hypothetical protein